MNAEPLTGEEAVATFMASIPDDGLPDHHGVHYRVVTVCGHCGVVWSSLFCSTRPTKDPDLWRDVVAFVRWSANVRDDTSEAVAIAKALDDRLLADR